MWYVPITRDNPLLTRRSLAQLKQEVEHRVQAREMPVAGMALDDARAALAAIDSLERDAWAQAFSARADRWLERAASLEARSGDEAREAFRQAWRLFSFARWPVENTPFKRYTYPRALAAFRNFGRLLDPPLEMVAIPFRNETIVGYLRLPRAPRPAPLVLGISGLDSRKEDVMVLGRNYLERGLALFAVDMPGTGEAPAGLGDDADGMFAAILDHLAGRADVDAKRIVVQGRSWSGYWAARLAITERARLRGAVVHGGPIHEYFQPRWLAPSLDSPEYLYDYLPATAALFGAATLDDLLARAPRFSLLDAGLLDRPAAPMLLVNGARDSQIPIGDLTLLRDRSDARDTWINPAGGHMGRSPEWPGERILDEVVMPWIINRLDLN